MIVVAPSTLKLPRSARAKPPSLISGRVNVAAPDLHPSRTHREAVDGHRCAAEPARHAQGRGPGSQCGALQRNVGGLNAHARNFELERCDAAAHFSGTVEVDGAGRVGLDTVDVYLDGSLEGQFECLAVAGGGELGNQDVEAPRAEFQVRGVVRVTPLRSSPLLEIVSFPNWRPTLPSAGGRLIRPESHSGRCCSS